MTKTYRFLLLTFCLAVLNFGAFAQEANPFATSILKTQKGFLVVDNNPNVSYTIEFEGKDIQLLETESIGFVLDERLVQIVNVPRANFWKPESGETTDERLLRAHQVWESDYLGKAMNAKLSVDSEAFDLAAKKKALYWTFSMPESFESSFSHQIFLTTVIGNNVLGLNSSLEKGSDQAAARAYLMKAIETLKLSDTPFDIQKLSQELREPAKTE